MLIWRNDTKKLNINELGNIGYECMTLEQGRDVRHLGGGAWFANKAWRSKLWWMFRCDISNPKVEFKEDHIWLSTEGGNI